MNKCDQCGKFLSSVTAQANVFKEIAKVTGVCKKHGEVEVFDWDYEQFFSEMEECDLTEVTTNPN